MRPSFVAPELDPELGIAHCLTPDSLAAALDASPGRGRRDGRLARPTSAPAPTSPGSPRSRTSAACRWRRRGLGRPPALPPRPARPTRSAAAPTWSSPRPTRSSAASPRRRCSTSAGERIDEAVVDRCVSLVESTSPSALLSGSLDAARRLAGGPRRASCSSETLAGDRRDPRGDRARSPASPCSTSAWSAGRASPAGTRCGSRSTCAAPESSGYRLAKAAFERRRDRPRAARRERRRRDLRPRRAARRAPGERLVAALREAVGRLGDGEGGPAAGAAGAAAALGRAGDDAARGLPRARRRSSPSSRRRAGSRPSRSPPIRPASPTCSRASGSPARRSTTSARASRHGGHVRGGSDRDC